MTNISTQVIDSQKTTPLKHLCDMIAKSESNYKLALPSHIPSAKFVRIAQNAIANHPDLLNCDRNSLFVAINEAAKDGLPLDGRLAVLLIFGKSVKYVPMIAGLRLLARNSGLISSDISEIIYSNDKFIFYIKNGKVEIEHTPNLFNGNRGNPVGVYSTCVIRGTDEVIAEVVTAEQVQRVKNTSKAKNSLMWSDTGFWEEAWKKTAFRRMWKRLPSSSDKEDNDLHGRFESAVQRDDDLYDMNVVEARIESENITPINKQTKVTAVVLGTGNQEEIPFDNNSNDDDII